MLLESSLGKMIIYLQWAMAVPQDWTAVDITRDQQIRNAAKKAVPTGGEVLDNNPGWINAANCQGISFSGYDHIAVQVSGNGLIITGWEDDPVDFPPGTRYAIQWNLQPPAFDPKVNEINTIQTLKVWAEANAGIAYDNPLPWSQFVLPPANQTFHGIWVSDQEFQDHAVVRSVHGWKEWI